MAHHITYWTSTNAINDEGQWLDFLQSGKLTESAVQPNDVIWILTAKSNELYLAGKAEAETVLSQEAATIRYKRDFSSSKVVATKFPYLVLLRAITSDIEQIGFEGSHPKLSPNGAEWGQQMQSLRTPTADCIKYLERTWNKYWPEVWTPEVARLAQKFDRLMRDRYDLPLRGVTKGYIGYGTKDNWIYANVNHHTLDLDIQVHDFVEEAQLSNHFGWPVINNATNVKTDGVRLGKGNNPSLIIRTEEAIVSSRLADFLDQTLIAYDVWNERKEKIQFEVSFGGTLEKKQDETVEEQEARSEGNYSLISHLRRERDYSLRAAKIKETLKKHGILACECCDTVFEKRYGEVGVGYIEVHHLKPLSEGPRSTMLQDLALLCSNCHRMIHRTRPMERPDIFSNRLKH